MKQLFIALFLVCLCAGTVGAAPDPVPTGITHEGTIYDATTNTTAFWYNVWPTTPAVSHVVLAICGTPLSVSWPHTKQGYDPATELSGLKLDNLPDLQAPLSVSIVMAGHYTDQTINWRLKAGQSIIDGATLGPKCGPNAVALTQLSALPAGILGWLAHLVSGF